MIDCLGSSTQIFGKTIHCARRLLAPTFLFVVCLSAGLVACDDEAEEAPTDAAEATETSDDASETSEEVVDIAQEPFEETTPDRLAVSMTADPNQGIAPLDVSLSATITGGTQPYTYSWDFADETTSEESTPDHTFQSGEFNVGLTVTDGLGDNAHDQTTIEAREVPGEFAALYQELWANLSQLDAEVDELWDGTQNPDSQFAAQLRMANGNAGPYLLFPARMQRAEQMLDAFVEMGVDVVKIEVMYPLLTEGFHDSLRAHPELLPAEIEDYQATVQDYVDFYTEVGTMIRERNMEIMLGHANMFPSMASSDPSIYYEEVKATGGRDRFRDERLAEALRYLEILQPEYFTILEEPDVQNIQFGLIEGEFLYDEQGWVDYVEHSVAGINEQAPDSTTFLGAGAGTWGSSFYVEQFCTIAELDYIDFHVYLFRDTEANYYQRVLEWANYIQSNAPDKFITIGESWLYKVGAEEWNPENFDFIVEIFSRNVYSFWEPIDQQFLEIFYQIVHLEGIRVWVPFWTTHFFVYVDYDDDTVTYIRENAGPRELMYYAGQQSAQPVADVDLTGTGETYVDIMSR